MDYEYIDTASQLDALVRQVEGQPLLAVDTEAAGYHRYLDRLSLVQISSRDANFLIDPLALADLSALGRCWPTWGWRRSSTMPTTI